MQRETYKQEQTHIGRQTNLHTQRHEDPICIQTHMHTVVFMPIVWAFTRRVAHMLTGTHSCTHTERHIQAYVCHTIV